MASSTIIKENIKLIATTYSLWTIGLTIDPVRREVAIGNPIGWRLFEADTEQVAMKVEAHFVGAGMKVDADGPATGAKFVFIFMGLKATLEDDRSFHRARTSAGLSTPKSMTWPDRYLADFETMFGDRPDYPFLQGVYAQVATERDPNCATVGESLAIFYRRLESLGIVVADLAYAWTNKTPSALQRRQAYRPPLTSS